MSTREIDWETHHFAGGNPSARFSASETPNRAFSPAVGSEVKTAAAEVRVGIHRAPASAQCRLAGEAF